VMKRAGDTDDPDNQTRHISVPEIWRDGIVQALPAMVIVNAMLKWFDGGEKEGERSWDIDLYCMVDGVRGEGEGVYQYRDDLTPVLRVLPWVEVNFIDELSNVYLLDFELNGGVKGEEQSVGIQ
jgi:hypothetical protein